MKFGNCQVEFSRLKRLDKVLEYFKAVPKPDLKKLSWVNVHMQEAKTYFKIEDDLIWSDFNVTNVKLVSLLKKALDFAGITYTQEQLLDGNYRSDVFIIGQYALYTTCLRRGGRGILMANREHVDYRRARDKETRIKNHAREVVVNTLTPKQKKALGL